MASIRRRLGDIVKNLSPEDMARLVIEDTFRDQSTLSAAERRKMLCALDEKGASRYTAFIEGYRVLDRNLSTLILLSTEIHKDMLKRDRLLWYREALIRMEEAIFLDTVETGVSEGLLLDNPALRFGKSVDFTVPFAMVRLGVGGRKRDSASDYGGVEFVGEFVDALDRGTDAIRSQARVLKALYRYVTEGASEMGLEGVRKMADATVDEVAGHDRTMKKVQRRLEERERGWGWGGLTYEEWLQRIITEEADALGDGAFIVDAQWALEWDEVEEDSQTCQRIRENPGDWIPHRS